MTEVINETDFVIDGSEFAALADHVLTQMHVATDVELNILFISSAREVPTTRLCRERLVISAFARRSPRNRHVKPVMRWLKKC